MITKEICRDYALKIKEETGKFPTVDDWLIKKGFPCSSSSLYNLFNSYNLFRDYCNEPHILRKEQLTLDWIKSNCIIDRNKCWNWNKALTNGYGAIGYLGQQYLVHRLSYELKYGEPSELLLVRHKCDNRKCCNPEHLELGTHSDNSTDTAIRNSNYKPINNRVLGGQIQKLKTIKERVNFYINNTIQESNCYISNLLKPSKDGYLYIQYDYKVYLLHRLILADKLNKNYDELDITRHTCNNRSCINPDHLIEGTKSENALDSRNYSKNTKLNKEKVLEIKKSLIDTQFSKVGDKRKFDTYWAEKFSVSFRTIADIRLNKTWKDIKI